MSALEPPWVMSPGGGGGAGGSAPPAAASPPAAAAGTPASGAPAATPASAAAAPPGAAVPPGGAAPPGGPVTEAEAQKLFDDLAAHKEIPFDYPPDCCYARASAMGDLLAQKGVEAKKVWTYGVLKPMVGQEPVRFPPGTGRPITWGYHVAPTIPVRRASGVVEDMVMDPSLAKTPLTIDEWNALMRGPGSSITETTQTARDLFARVYDDKGKLHIIDQTPAFDRNTAFKEHIINRAAGLGR